MFVVEFAIPNDIPLIMFNGWYKQSTYRRMFMIISECCLYCFAVGVMMWKIDDIFGFRGLKHVKQKTMNMHCTYPHDRPYFILLHVLLITQFPKKIGILQVGI